MSELKRVSVKSKVEAVLFSTGHRIGIDEISRLCRSRKEEVLAALKELQKEYEDKQSSLMLVEEGDFWKFRVRDHFIPMVRKIVTETELTKTVLETLAVIAFKYPILQSDLIKLRTNKSYDHLVELEKSGYISRRKHGRTNLIKLTEKFFKYFDLTEEKLKDKFKDFESIAKAIKDKEEEVETIKEDQRKRAEELKQQDERIKKEIESLDKAEEEFEVPLEPYGEKPQEPQVQKSSEGALIVDNEKLGELEIVKTTPDKAKEKEGHEEQQNQGQSKTKQIFGSHEHSNPAEHKGQRKTKDGIKLTPEMEKKVEEQVNEMLGIQEQDKEKEDEKVQ